MLAMPHTALARQTPPVRCPDLLGDALVAGGDHRLLLREGVNAYGNGPRPEPGLIALGSSTASVVSVSALRAAGRLHGALAGGMTTAVVEARRTGERIRQLSGAAWVPGSTVLLAASGTDVHRDAARLARGAAPALAVVMAEAGETGTLVPSALGGDTTAVALRHADGSLRDAAEVDADFACRARRAVTLAGRCLLVATDVSKTGLRAPSPDCLLQLRAELGDRLRVLVDACQTRLPPDAVAAYLAAGFMVAVTGSKFIGGPAFCGALLLPPALRCAPQEPPHLGVLLRWEAALDEWQRYAALPRRAVHDFLAAWSDVVAQRIARSPWLEALPATSPYGPQTLFAFTVRLRGASGFYRPMPPDTLAALHRRLRYVEGHSAASLARVQLGQPVACGERHGMPARALRLSAGARTVTDGVGVPGGLELALQQASRAIDKVEWLAARLA